jgi:hypothetical protein
VMRTFSLYQRMSAMYPWLEARIENVPASLGELNIIWKESNVRLNPPRKVKIFPLLKPTTNSQQ